MAGQVRLVEWFELSVCGAKIDNHLSFLPDFLVLIGRLVTNIW